MDIHMFSTKRERILFTIVLFSGMALIVYVLFTQVGQSWFAMSDKIESKKSEINYLLEIQDQAVEIQNRYQEMQDELTLPGSDSEQYAAIRKELAAIFEEVGLKDKYGSISQKDPKMEEDFKVVSLSIAQIECTPQQLGQLLHRLEKKSKVMEVENCRITNLMNEVGNVSSRRMAARATTAAPAGLLEVDLQISRLVEYRKGEKPARRR